MNHLFHGYIGRFIRSLVAIIIGGIAAQYGDSSLYLVIAPAILALSKFLRDKYGIDVKLV